MFSMPSMPSMGSIGGAAGSAGGSDSGGILKGLMDNPFFNNSGEDASDVYEEDEKEEE